MQKHILSGETNEEPIAVDNTPSIPNPPTLQERVIDDSILTKFQQRKLFNIPRCIIELDGILFDKYCAIHRFVNFKSFILSYNSLYSLVQRLK